MIKLICAIVAACLMWMGNAMAQESCPYVSMYSILADPQAFNGTCVTVKGYIWIEFEAHYIWLKKEYQDEFKPDYALWVELDDVDYAVIREVNGRYCRVSGIFNQCAGAHLIPSQGLQSVSIGECEP